MNNTTGSNGIKDDPIAPDWAQVDLPDAWPDQLRLRNPLHLWRLMRTLLGERRRVQLPPGMPGADDLPKYLLQEFHHLPNGNYSKQLTHGYITGFDRLMLGHMRHARRRMMQALRDCHSVLDIGTAGGRTAHAAWEHSARDVWGIDPSPYLLQHAARRFPQLRFIQGTAERLPFPDARFDAITACFVLHEMPPRYIAQALRECRRVLKPGGLLSICEPAPSQVQSSLVTLWKRHGFAGVYFGVLARLVHEPFLRSWHRLDMARELAAAGFALRSDEEHFPSRHVLAQAS